MAKIVDVETRKSASDVGGWHNKSKMGVSVAVSYDTVAKDYRFYTQEEAGALCQDILSADLVVGFNIIGFDYEVLQPNCVFSLKDTPTLDLLVDIEKSIGKRVSLDNICEHTLGLKKTGHGLEALQWFKEGRLADIGRYCAFDVKATRLVAEFGAVYGCVRYSDKNSGKVLTAKVDWKIPWVPESFPPQTGKIAGVLPTLLPTVPTLAAFPAHAPSADSLSR
jgi:DEAD/DEAH box helicase domain-containing protein